MNSLLPDDVAVTGAENAPEDFHVRFDAKGKEYRYFVHLSSRRDPFKRHYAFQSPYAVNLDNIKIAAADLQGTHDFTSFCSAKTEVEDKVREIQEIDVLEEGDMLIFCFKGTGFLYNMVRILAGTLLEVGTGERDPNSMPSVIKQKDRSAAGKTAPPQGLYLWKVFY